MVCGRLWQSESCDLFDVYFLFCLSHALTHMHRIPDMGATVTLRELVPIDRAKELTMTGRIFPGTEAHSMGLVDGLAEDPFVPALAFAQEVAAAAGGGGGVVDEDDNNAVILALGKEAALQARSCAYRSFKHVGPSADMAGAFRSFTDTVKTGGGGGVIDEKVLRPLSIDHKDDRGNYGSVARATLSQRGAGTAGTSSLKEWGDVLMQEKGVEGLVLDMVAEEEEDSSGGQDVANAVATLTALASLVRSTPVPVIVTMRGGGWGSGNTTADGSALGEAFLAVALAADFRLAAPSCRLHLAEGLLREASSFESDGGEPAGEGPVAQHSDCAALLRTVVPRGRLRGALRELREAATAAPSSSSAWSGGHEEAMALGAVTGVMPACDEQVLEPDLERHEQLNARLAATRFLKSLTGRSPDAVSAAKQLFNETWHADDAYSLVQETEVQMNLLYGWNHIAATTQQFLPSVLALQFSKRTRNRY